MPASKIHYSDPDTHAHPDAHFYRDIDLYSVANPHSDRNARRAGIRCPEFLPRERG